MAVTSQSMGVTNFATGSFTGAAAIATETLGFTPRHVIVWDDTNVIRWECAEGMPATKSIKTVTAGTTTSDATTAITLGENSISFSAGLAASAAAISWSAWG